MDTDTPTKQHKGFRLRGEGMDRIETFVAAAFAFAVTMLVISVGTVPGNFSEFLHAVKQIPSFAASFAVIVWIWSAHANWCRRYGLEDGPTVFLSALLVFLVLIYIYPLRIMMQGLLTVMTGGYLPVEMDFGGLWQVRFMFGFYAIGFLLLALNFIGLYSYALKQRSALQLSALETYETHTDWQAWALTGAIACSSLLLAIILPDQHLGWSGYCYFLMFPVLTSHGVFRGRRRPRNPG